MKHKAIPKKIRQQVYDKYNGRCAYCGCKLEYKDMQVDHIESVYMAIECLDKEVDDSRKKAAAIAQKAQWESFIEYYQKAYSIALNKKIKK